MPVAADGILAAAFVAESNFVTLQTVGAAWPEPIVTVSVTRTAAGAGTVPVRDLTHKSVVGGVLLWSDNEAPLDAEVTYTATGHGDAGQVVAVSTVTVSTSGAEWGLWLKAPGRADLNTQATLSRMGDIDSATDGGSYQVPGGPRIAEHAGVVGDVFDFDVDTYDAAGASALTALLATTRLLLLQTGAPEELTSGYYRVVRSRRANPAQVRIDEVGLRRFTLEVEQVAAPAGEGSGFFGVSHGSIAATYATHQAIADSVASHLDLAMGV